MRVKVLKSIEHNKPGQIIDITREKFRNNPGYYESHTDGALPAPNETDNAEEVAEENKEEEKSDDDDESASLIMPMWTTVVAVM